MSNQLQKVSSLKAMLNATSVKEQFQNSLKNNAGAFISSLIELFSSDSHLQKCEPKLVILEALKAASLKLPINKSLGFAYIIPRKNVPQFQLGYKGLIQLAQRSGQYRIINADGLPEGFEIHENILSGEIEIKGSKTSDKIQGYFAHFELLNGFKKTIYWEKQKIIDHAKKYSQSYASNYSPWKNNFEEMAVKTVLSKLLRTYGILSTEMQSAIVHDQKDFVYESPQEEIENNANSEKFAPEKEVKVDESTGEVELTEEEKALFETGA